MRLSKHNLISFSAVTTLSFNIVKAIHLNFKAQLVLIYRLKPIHPAKIVQKTIKFLKVG